MLFNLLRECLVNTVFFAFMQNMLSQPQKCHNSQSNNQTNVPTVLTKLAVQGKPRGSPSRPHRCLYLYILHKWKTIFEAKHIKSCRIHVPWAATRQQGNHKQDEASRRLRECNDRQPITRINRTQRMRSIRCESKAQLSSEAGIRRNRSAVAPPQWFLWSLRRSGGAPKGHRCLGRPFMRDTPPHRLPTPPRARHQARAPSVFPLRLLLI